MKPTLLIVDDEEEIRTQLKWTFTAEYEVVVAADRSSAIEAFRAHRPFVTLLDLGLPPQPGTPEEGFATLSAILAIDSQAKVIILSGQGERENAMQAIGLGAYQFVVKPAQTDELQLILRLAANVARLEREFRELKRTSVETDIFEGMLGNSAAMQKVFNAVRRVANSNAPVLILGESGTGKELAAQAIHRRSSRKDGPFVAINCGAIPEHLLESELFGHEKGAFTGAHVSRPGRIEMASAGTLFLDEVGELPLALQVKLLRFLQEHRITRIGGRKEIAVDARVISATNVDLDKARTEGRFREDLYFRLAVVSLRMPLLREREGDIVMLAQAFLRRFAGANDGVQHLVFDPDALKAIERHAWPGNVRELENRVQRAVIMASGSRITNGDLELKSTQVSPAASDTVVTLKAAREALEKEVILQALRRHNGKISPAASELDISRPTLYELLEKLGIDRNTLS